VTRLISILCLFFFLMGCVASQQGSTTSKAVASSETGTPSGPGSDPLEIMANLGQDEPDFSIDIWTDKKRYHIGEAIRFFFRSDRDCYLTLVDYQTNGDVLVLFPNRYCQDNFIKAGTTYVIPDADYGFTLTVEPPAGLERIKAIATVEPLSLLDLNFDRKCFTQVEKHNTRSMRSISIALDKLSRLHWAENICTISVR
jgi:hypothetical protein